MPLYEYECDACGHRFEVIQKFSDPLVKTCPKCKSPVHKLFSSPAIQFKGSGFYITDYPKGEKGSAPKSDGGKSDQAEKAGKAEKSEKPDASGKSEKTEKSEKAEKSDTSAKGETSSKTDKGSSGTSSSSASSTPAPSPSSSSTKKESKD
jgi:putative FmdB family regulatory protein